MEYQNLTQNQKKTYSSLGTKSKRNKHGLFLVEGEKLCQELLSSNYDIISVIVRNEASEEAEALAELFLSKRIRVLRSQNHHFDQIATTNSPQDIMAVAEIKKLNEKIDYPLVVLDSISDPGNMGTIIRTCDWFGFRHIVLYGECADIYNPKVVRASMGSVFRAKFNELESPELLINPGIDLYGSVLGAKTDLRSLRPEGQFGIVMGSESHGISPEMLKVCTRRFSIEGKGKAESLNVSIASGIILHHFSEII
jgi:RNA methyltransferase, TrmH family